MIKEKNIKELVNISNIVVERPKKQHQGDYSTNVTMVLGTTLSSNPGFGEKLRNKLKDEELINNVKLDGPGFLNIKINPKVWDGLMIDIIKNGIRYGEVNFGRGRKVNIEFVSQFRLVLSIWDMYEAQCLEMYLPDYWNS